MDLRCFLGNGTLRRILGNDASLRDILTVLRSGLLDIKLCSGCSLLSFLQRFSYKVRDCCILGYIIFICSRGDPDDDLRPFFDPLLGILSVFIFHTDDSTRSQRRTGLRLGDHFESFFLKILHHLILHLPCHVIQEEPDLAFADRQFQDIPHLYKLSGSEVLQHDQIFGDLVGILLVGDLITQLVLGQDRTRFVHGIIGNIRDIYFIFILLISGRYKGIVDHSREDQHGKDKNRCRCR